MPDDLTSSAFLLFPTPRIRSGKRAVATYCSIASIPVWLVLLCSVLGVRIAAAQQLPFTHYTPDSEINPLPSAEVQSVYQDANGFIWFVVYSSGLVRYDGHRMEVFGLESGLIDLRARQIVQDSTGHLWVNSDGGLVVSEMPLGEYGPGERPHFVSSFGETDLVEGAIGEHQGLAVAPDRSVWVASPASGITRYSFRQDGTLRETRIRTTYGSSETDMATEALTVGTDGHVWASLQERNRGLLAVFDPDGAKAPRIYRTPGDVAIKSLAAHSDGSMLAATRLPPSLLKLTVQTDGSLQASLLSRLEDDVSKLSVSSDGVVWYGTVGAGVYLIDARDGSMRHVSRENALLSNSVRDVFEDREGNIWLSQAPGGVSKLRSGFQAYESFSSTSFSGETPALPAAGVSSFIAGDDYCDLWIGTGGGVVCRIGRQSHWLLEEDGLQSDQINALAADGLGRIWLGTADGIAALSFAGQRHPPSTPATSRVMVAGRQARLSTYRHTTISSASVSSIRVHESSDRTVEALWLPGYRSVYLLAEERWFVFRAKSGLPPTSYQVSELDSTGHLWVGTYDQGLFRSRMPITLAGLDALEMSEVRGSFGPTIFGREIEADVFEPVSRASDIVTVTALKWHLGSMWVGSLLGGLTELSISGEWRSRLNVTTGLPSNSVGSIAVHPKTGHLWIGTHDGLAEVNPRLRRVVRTTTKQDGLLDNEVYFNGSVMATEGGAILFGTVKGASVYRPDLDVSSSVLPRPALRVADFTDNIWGKNNLQIEYAALSFRKEKAVQYRTRLVGFDEDWSEPTQDNRIRYTNLPAWLFPKTYTFELSASNGEDVWTEAPLTLDISVSPPWFLRWWAVLGYVLAIVLAVVGYIWQHTRKHRIELAREREISEKLQRANKLKDEFLANTSHELRTPLNGIIGIVESLMDGVEGSLSRGVMSNLSMVVSSGRRLANLVNDILDFSKLKDHHLELQLKPVDVRVLTEVILRVSSPLKANKPIELKNEIPETLPRARADENRLQQILQNLIGNAIKFTHEGEVVVRAEALESELKISICDTGIGIPADKRDQVFKSFEQVDASTQRQYGGTGLGLSITRQLVELHGGTVDFESEVGKGSTFWFTIPSTLEKATEPEKTPLAHVEQMEQEREVLLVPTAAVIENGQGSILVVDDEPVNQQVLRNHLVAARYSVVPAMNGNEALDHLASGPTIDLVLLDVMMPRMSGYEVCRKIRETRLPGELPVIMVTAKNQISDLVQGFDSGANDYLAKPFSKDELLARVKTHLHLLNINKSYSRFVPREFLAYLKKESILDVHLGDSVEAEMTIFASDIRSFTTLSERMTPEESFNFINEYLELAGPVIRDRAGFIDHFIGDAVLALFPERADDGIDAAVDTLKSLATLNEQREVDGAPPIRIGIGLHTGKIRIGIVGERERAQGDIVSDAVNLAARVEGLTKLYGASIIITDDTLERVQHPDAYNMRFMGRVRVKGKAEPVSIFEVFDAEPEPVVAERLRTKEQFDDALKKYFEGRFAECRASLEDLSRNVASDKAVHLYLENAKKLEAEGGIEDWDGVETISEK
jgi:signal transduction histidine kinase/class 3 adenylate cyclase/sugar lactone lactonase YvrE